MSILGDEVIRIGEVCKIGERIGTVEDISLRSTRIRTQEGTVLSVPNGELANMNLENISRRDRSLLRTQFGIQHETSSEQLRSLLLEISSLLRQHPKVESDDSLWARLIGFDNASLEVEVQCHILTSKLAEFMVVREQLLLQIMGLIADAGTGFALPSRLLYNTEAIKKEVPRESENLPILRSRAS